MWQGPHAELTALAREISDDEWKKVLIGLYCPGCDHKFASQYEEVETKKDLDLQIERIFERIHDKRTTKSLEGFNQFISLFPYLGTHNSLGKRLFKSIKAGKTSSIISPQAWFRARLVNAESRVFSSYEMGAPNPKKIALPEGRFNHAGQAFLYLSSDKETAHREIIGLENSITIVQRFKLTKIYKILDLRQDYTRISPGIDICSLQSSIMGTWAKCPRQLPLGSPSISSLVI